jgi:hypothetical protein
LNLAGLVFFLGYGWLFTRVFRLFRPTFNLADLSPNVVTNLIALLLASVGVIFVHELVHGLFFWIFLRDRPKFGLRGSYAFAAAPAWYIPRGPYVMVGLAPLVVITLAGLAALLYIPQAALPTLWFALTLNAAGAVGDIFIVGWLYFQPPAVLVNDQGDRFSMFLPH